MAAITTGHHEMARGFVKRLLKEPRRPVSVREHRHAHWFAVLAVCLGAFMGQLDASIVNLAYRPIEVSFHTSLAGATWTGLAYLLVVVALVTPIGRVADVFGRKLLYLYGFGIFVVGSGLCGLAPDLRLLIAFRVLQGIGAAMMQANSLAIIALVMPGSQLGRGIGIQGAAQALGLALGPTVGGLLVATGGWHLIFLVNVPVGIVGILLGRQLIPRSRDLAERTSFDWRGALLLPPAAGLLLAAISLGDGIGWSSPLVIAMLAGAVALSAAFVAQERRSRFPMLDLSLFAQRGYSAAISSSLLSYLVLFGTLFVIPLYLVAGLHTSPVAAGLQLTIMPIALGLVAPVSGRLAELLGPRPLTVGGMALAAGALGLLGFSGSDEGLRLVALGLLGAGMGIFTPANNAAVMSAVPRTATGLVSGVLNMTRGLGTALGLALTTLVFEAFAGSVVSGSGNVSMGFRGAVLALAVVACMAAFLAALRGSPPPDDPGPAAAAIA
ncbi:MAG: MFS transporter [Acidimicrobiales bacterium]|jgi:EmrB/QacA subfamily drug resistance transporter